MDKADETSKEIWVYHDWFEGAIKLPRLKRVLAARKILSEQNVKTNVTLCFSASQDRHIVHYISPFVGRMNDNSFIKLSNWFIMTVVYTVLIVLTLRLQQVCGNRIMYLAV